MSAATSTTAASLANSLGWRPWPPTMIQRRAPLTTLPTPGTSTATRPTEHEPGQRYGGAAPPGVVDAREHPHGAHAEQHPQQLPLDEVEARVVLEVGLGGRGAVGHHQAVHDQQERDEDDARGARRRRGPAAAERRCGAARRCAGAGRSGRVARRRRRRGRGDARSGAPARGRRRRARGGRAGRRSARRSPRPDRRPSGVVQVRLAHAVPLWTHDGPAPRRSFTSLRKCSPRST